MVDPEDWRLISQLAQEDKGAYVDGLGGTFGRRWAEEIAEHGLEGDPPDTNLVGRARRARLLRYARHCLRSLRIGLTEATRLGLWIARPTGFHVLVFGPDGSGKSTVALMLAERGYGLCGTSWSSYGGGQWGIVISLGLKGPWKVSNRDDTRIVQRPSRTIREMSPRWAPTRPY